MDATANRAESIAERSRPTLLLWSFLHDENRQQYDRGEARKQPSQKEEEAE